MEEQKEQLTVVMSPTIGKITAAMVEVQRELPGAEENSENPHYGSKYADLESCWECCRELLAKNGLAVIQPCAGTVTAPSIITLLLHSSGEWIRGELIMSPDRKGPQGIGSCITYARRYSLCAMVGISPHDDDGEDATKHGPVDQPEAQKEEPTKKFNTASNEGWTLTDDPVPSEYWKDKDQSLLGGKGHTARKNPMGKWVIAIRDDVPF